MINFKPEQDYNGLLRQAWALYHVAVSKERQLADIQDKFGELELKLLLIDDAAVNAERSTNEILTNKIEEIELNSIPQNNEPHG